MYWILTDKEREHMQNGASAEKAHELMKEGASSLPEFLQPTTPIKSKPLKFNLENVVKAYFNESFLDASPELMEHHFWSALRELIPSNHISAAAFAGWLKHLPDMIRHVWGKTEEVNWKDSPNYKFILNAVKTTFHESYRELTDDLLFKAFHIRFPEFYKSFPFIPLIKRYLREAINEIYP